MSIYDTSVFTPTISRSSDFYRCKALCVLVQLHAIAMMCHPNRYNVLVSSDDRVQIAGLILVALFRKSHLFRAKKMRRFSVFFFFVANDDDDNDDADGFYNRSHRSKRLISLLLVDCTTSALTRT